MRAIQMTEFGGPEVLRLAELPRPESGPEEALIRVSRAGLKIFETSGTASGQQTAFGLLDFGAYLAIVGFTSDKVEIRLSNLMAFDATARGNWGCPPEKYPAALQLVLDGKVAIAPYVEMHSMDDLPQLIDAHTRLRPVLVP